MAEFSLTQCVNSTNIGGVCKDFSVACARQSYAMDPNGAVSSIPGLAKTSAPAVEVSGNTTSFDV